MAKFATHRNPARRPARAVILRGRLDDIEDGENFEQIWSERVTDDLFEVCCIPFFAYSLAFGDVVRADADNEYEIQSVEKRSGNGVVRVAISPTAETDAVHLQLHNLIGRLEYLCEWFAPGYVAVNVEPDRSNDEFFAGLDALGTSIEVERILV